MPAYTGTITNLQIEGWRMVKSETRRDAEILVRNPSPRLFGEKFWDSKKVKTNMKKTILQDLSKTFPTFWDPAKIFRDLHFSRYHSPPLDCFEHPKNSLLKSSHPKKYLPKFSFPTKILKSEISNPKKSFNHPCHLESGVSGLKELVIPSSGARYMYPRRLIIQFLL